MFHTASQHNNTIRDGVCGPGKTKEVSDDKKQNRVSCAGGDNGAPFLASLSDKAASAWAPSEYPQPRKEAKYIIIIKKKSRPIEFRHGVEHG